MSARENILNRVKKNQPPEQLPKTPTVKAIQYGDHVDAFRTTLVSIGGSVVDIETPEQIRTFIKEKFPTAQRVISRMIKLNGADTSSSPRDYHNVDVAILAGRLAVAENGAVWIDDKEMIDRAIPFICENLMLIVKKSSIMHNLAQAYETLENYAYDYGTFIAGPSKTADIEQSLVLGAHGAKTLTVFIMQD